MKTILSYGAGVNSTAIMALILQGKLEYEDFEVVFCDTGAEKPETYCYLKYIQKQVPWKITIIKPRPESMAGCDNLLDYCNHYKIIPLRMFRWCTDKFKIRPFNEYTKQFDDFQHILGIDYGEKRRMKDNAALYPLIDLGINREDCKKIIEAQGWEVPLKSGCFCCPFARKAEFFRLRHEHPDLWKKVVDMEHNALSRSSSALLKGIPIEDWVDTQQTILKPFENRHCLCQFD